MHNQANKVHNPKVGAVLPKVALLFCKMVQGRAICRMNVRFNCQGGSDFTIGERKVLSS